MPAYTPRVSGLPLDGVRVVDLTTVVSGPYGTLLLSDFGADVVKVESPGGDVARDLGPRAHEGMAAVFLSCNRGKRSVVLDLQTDHGRARLAQLVASSDVLVHNMRRDAAVRCGADPDTLLAVNPNLVHCAIVGFGPDGPYADLPAYDDTVQGVAGIAGAQSWMHGENRPTRPKPWRTRWRGWRLRSRSRRRCASARSTARARWSRSRWPS